MKYLLLPFLLTLFWAGCDSREESIDQLNDPPYFLLEGDTVSFVTDSVKSSLGAYILSASVIDPNENLSSLSFNSIEGSGEFSVNNSVVETQVAISGSIDEIIYNADFDGLHVFEIIASDDFGEKAILEVSLTAFNNIAPTAVIRVTKPPGTGPFERLIDATASFDGDEKFGGVIEMYEFTFLGIVLEIAAPTQTVIFPSEGTYQVRVRVLDNDGEWSEIVAINETI